MTHDPSGKLLELAAKCEAAKADQQSALILQAWESYNPEPFRGHRSELEEHREWREAYNRIYDLLKAGGFLDAAMTLVPTDGSMNFVAFTWSWEPGEAGVYPAAAVRWYPPHHSGPDWHAEVVSAASMPLTICAAALKVRARARAHTLSGDQ